MHDQEYEKLMLASIIKDFVEFADFLKNSGKISDEVHNDITINKIKFLEKLENNEIKCDGARQS